MNIPEQIERVLGRHSGAMALALIAALGLALTAALADWLSKQAVILCAAVACAFSFFATIYFWRRLRACERAKKNMVYRDSPPPRPWNGPRMT